MGEEANSTTNSSEDIFNTFQQALGISSIGTITTIPMIVPSADKDSRLVLIKFQLSDFDETVILDTTITLGNFLSFVLNTIKGLATCMENIDALRPEDISIIDPSELNSLLQDGKNAFSTIERALSISESAPEKTTDI